MLNSSDHSVFILNDKSGLLLLNRLLNYQKLAKNQCLYLYQLPFYHVYVSAAMETPTESYCVTEGYSFMGILFIVL